MKISACMIAKNESANIEKCIKSYREAVDEIIVADTGSTDNTAELAEKLGAKVFFTEWNNDFAAAKNFALKHASGSWIVFLDADEYFPEKSAQNLKKIIEEADKDKNIEAIQCRIYNIHKKNNEIIDVHPTVRIFRNDPEIKYAGRIHEAPKKCGRFLKAKISDNLEIYHTGYSSDIIEEKLERNILLLEEEAKAEKPDELVYYYLCENYIMLGKNQDALKYADAFLSGKDAQKLLFSVPQAFRIYIYKSIAMQNLKNFSYEEMHEVIKEGTEKFPFHPEIKNREAEFFYDCGKMELAAEAFMQAVTLHKNYNKTYSNNFKILMCDALIKAGIVYTIKDDFLAAFDCFADALKLNKYNKKAFSNLVRLVENQPSAEIIRFLSTIYDESSQEDVKFLFENLAQNGIKEPFLYFFIKKWKGGYQDYIYFVVLASIMSGNTQNAADAAFKAFKDAENEKLLLLITVSLICGNHYEWYAEKKEHLGNRFMKFLEAFFEGKQCFDFSPEEKRGYIDILSEILLLKNIKAAELFIEKTKFISHKMRAETGKAFMNARLYEKALQFFAEASEDAKYGIEKADNDYNIAYCLYKIKRYEDSLEYFNSVLSNNFVKNYKPLQFLKWIADKNIDEGLAEKTRNLIERYESLYDKNICGK